MTRETVAAMKSGGRGYQRHAAARMVRQERFFFDCVLATPVRVATDLPAWRAALPADLAAPVTPRAAEVAAPFAALPACEALRAAPRAWLVDAAFLPPVCDLALVALRLRVAAAFCPAALRSALV